MAWPALADSRQAVGRLIVLRHGQSEFNAANLFTGWADPPLTPRGADEAVRAGEAIAAAGHRPTSVHTSLLRRAVDTADLVVRGAGCGRVPVYRTWRLNGRHYGALQGRDKTMVRAQYGARLVDRWRRSYEERPPELPDDPNASDPRYANLPPGLLPHAESLRDVQARLMPYWRDAIVPDLRAGGTVLVVSHANTLRALIKHLDRISDDAITRVEVPTARPLLYRMDASMMPIAPGGVYLDDDRGQARRPGPAQAARRV
jgi:2,3-bisphosphoglycerate-dependent phosphoglycerate mutase